MKKVRRWCDQPSDRGRLNLQSGTRIKHYVSQRRASQVVHGCSVKRLDASCCPMYTRQPHSGVLVSLSPQYGQLRTAISASGEHDAKRMLLFTARR